MTGYMLYDFTVLKVHEYVRALRLTFYNMAVLLSLKS